MPPGASDIKAIALWNDVLVSDLLGNGKGSDEEIACTLCMHFLTGVDAYSDYSGVKCLKERSSGELQVS